MRTQTFKENILRSNINLFKVHQKKRTFDHLSPINKLSLKTQPTQHFQKSMLCIRRQYKRKCNLSLLQIQNDQQLSLIEYELKKATKSSQKLIDVINQTFWICQKMDENIYNYPRIQSGFKDIILLYQKFREHHMIFKIYAFAGFVLYQYSSFSLALFYFDRALKSLYYISQQKIRNFQREKEILIFKYCSMILLKKNSFEEAEQLALKYLRKTWYTNNKQQELCAYDYLGKLYNQKQNISLSKYFHNRMCSGKTQQSGDLKKMSNMHLQRIEQQDLAYCGFQNISIFIEKDKQFHQFLYIYYRSQAIKQQTEQFQNLKNRNFLFTHKSHNRILINRHSLQRKLVNNKSSNQIHLVSPNICKQIKPLLLEFSRFIFNLQKKLKYKGTNQKKPIEDSNNDS